MYLMIVHTWKGQKIKDVLIVKNTSAGGGGYKYEQCEQDFVKSADLQWV